MIELAASDVDRQRVNFDNWQWIQQYFLSVCDGFCEMVCVELDFIASLCYRMFELINDTS